MSGGEDMRAAFAPMRCEGENACVIGPNEEIMVEVTHGSPEEQMALASRIANMLNHPQSTCADAGDIARYTLLLTERNSLDRHEAIETVHMLALDAGGGFARARIGPLTSDDLPF